MTFAVRDQHHAIRRALEVIESTGKSLVHWQREGSRTSIPACRFAKKLLLMPPREILHEKINARFDSMVSMGALAEVEQFLRRDIPVENPAMKAIGVPEFSRHLVGEITLDKAIVDAKTATRRYCKRQCTWFNNQFDKSWIRATAGADRETFIRNLDI